ncbi:type III PLP-dependent enzyme domain-containing protein [Chthoniobacter flavus]|uniref:hypothetical protein n=1 Tax=Chthoniobacter flavus TaxID=191863 RepID=UPI0005B291C3|nr:hypothetical protein [Chthoniobacter flavus]
MSATLETPRYFYSGELLTLAWHALHSSLPADAQLLYSLKANPHPTIVRYFAEHGALFDVASRGEMELLLATQGSLQRAVWISPCKREADYLWAVQHGLGASVIDSREEIGTVRRVAATQPDTMPSYLLRVQRRAASAGTSLWADSQFGVTLDEAIEFTHTLRRDGIQIAGLHGYFASNLFAEQEIAQNTQDLMAQALTWQASTGTSMRVLDVGGGFGWPLGVEDGELSLPRLRDCLAPLAAEFSPGTALWFESGRFLTAGAGVLVLTVMSVKERPGTTSVVLDGGMNIFGLPSMRLGFRPLTVILLAREWAGPLQPHTLFGPLCTPGDKFCEKVLLPPLKAGDRLAILHAGAYGATAGRSSFLSFPDAHETVLAG